MEIRVTDLMVGDWLMFNGKPCQVKGLHNDDTVTLTGYRSMYYLIDVEPIPLTPEILEKNGFELENTRSDSNSKDVAYLGINDRVELFHYDNNIGMSSDNEWDVYVCTANFYGMAECELTYVHEFQHLLRLCKIDKEIIV